MQTSWSRVRNAAIVALALVAATTAGWTAAVFLRTARADEPELITLMTTLRPWQYPGSEMPAGATMSDGGNPQVPSVKCQAILTTPDPIEKVIAFYQNKLRKTEAVARDGLKVSEDKSVSDLDDSEGRPVSLRVISVHKGDTSTTLAISRARGESKTHIAWLHYIRLVARAGRSASDLK